MNEQVDWSVFDREYPVKDGIVDALPPELDYKVEPKEDAETFFDVHDEVMQGRTRSNLLSNKVAMASLQKDFYDRMAVGFQAMDDRDLASGGAFWWKIHRDSEYDMKHFVGKKLLFVGAGNCRLARLYALAGYDVVATDISMNMLRVGKQFNDRLGVKMTYVAQNAEVAFPFKSGACDSVYSLCVQNHIVDWRNYISEKLRCIRKGGVLLERMPNGIRTSFWNRQGDLNEGVEIKALYCRPDTVALLIHELGLENLEFKIWTHDRQPSTLLSSKGATRTAVGSLVPNAYKRKVRLLVSKPWYKLRTAWEDYVQLPLHDDGTGIYTLLKITK